jgi:hypothetical protein
MDGMTTMVGRPAATADQGGARPAGISDRARLEAERRTVGVRPETRSPPTNFVPAWLDAAARSSTGAGSTP